MLCWCLESRGLGKIFMLLTWSWDKEQRHLGSSLQIIGLKLEIFKYLLINQVNKVSRVNLKWIEIGLGRMIEALKVKILRPTSFELSQSSIYLNIS